MMRCHYDVLGVPRDADEDTIKKSYRKLALKLHPDKNLDNVEAATLEFRVVQQAYDVLSDLQERAWYDKHREAILMGGMGKGEDYQDDSIDVYAYFNSACYTGFHDGDDGFYKVYCKVFERIAEEDYAFLDDVDSDNELPGFGDSLSEYDDVVGPFYGHWSSYCTTKSYVWCEKWDTRDAPDRMTRRAMEQENRKLCDAKRRERNEEVRALVAFVKKRDRRVIAYRKSLEEKAERNAQIAKEKRLNDRKEQLRKMEAYTETEWSSTSQLEEQLRALENNLTQEFSDDNEDEMNSSSDSEEEEEVIDDLYCIVCNKAFKTDKAMANHERSKKHKENVALLRDEMLADDEAAAAEITLSPDEDLDTVDNLPVKLSKKQKKRRRQQQKQNVESRDEDLEDESEVVNDVSDRLRDVSVTDTDSTAHIAGEEKAASGDDDNDDFVHKSSNKNKKSKKKTVAASSPIVIIQEKDPENRCKVCQQAFPTRSKLFKHINELGHAGLKTTSGEVTSELAAVDTKPKRRGKKSTRS